MWVRVAHTNNDLVCGWEERDGSQLVFGLGLQPCSRATKGALSDYNMFLCFGVGDSYSLTEKDGEEVEHLIEKEPVAVLDMSLRKDEGSWRPSDDLIDLKSAARDPESHRITQGALLSNQKLHKLREVMKAHGVAVYLVPSEDEHQSEYTALADRRREFLSGFTGSAGICVVTLDDDSLNGEAALSTDGRYFLQAEKELDAKNWRILKQGAAGYPTWQEYAVDKAEKSAVSNVISCDPRLISLSTGERFRRMSGKFRFEPIAENLVDAIWRDKPLRSLDPIYELPLKYSGESVSQKLERVRQRMVALKGTHLVVSALDEVAWLLNLRADTDIPFSPVFFSYVVVEASAVTLYIDQRKLTGVANYLATISGLAVKSTDEFLGDLRSLSSDDSVILPDKAATNYAIAETVAHVPSQFNSVVSMLKIVKNKTELFNATVAQHKDSLVFILLASWLELQLHKKHTLTEYDVACKIYALRSLMPHFKGLSYETIASSGANAAIIHYAPTKEKCKNVDPSKVFLLDSGAHYLEGTTDITRTYKFGGHGVTDRLRKLYTLVLKAHLAVAMAVFPGGPRSGAILDSYSRQPFWNENLDFNHGTGHGIGSFGNVHEGPLYISTTTGGSSDEDVFQVGGILSDEPGVYLEKEELGIRIESELEIIQHSSTDRSGKPMLAFRYLTQVPFCRKLIDKFYLSGPEIEWVNRYHRHIREAFAGQLRALGEVSAEQWLLDETRPI